MATKTLQQRKALLKREFDEFEFIKNQVHNTQNKLKTFLTVQPDSDEEYEELQEDLRTEDKYMQLYLS